MRFKLAAFADEAAASLEGQIRAMKENGIHYLEIRGVDGEGIDSVTPAKAKEIRKRLDDEGIQVWSIGSPFGKIGIGDNFTPHLDSFKRSLENAYILGTSHLRLFSFYGADHIEPVLARLESFIRAAKGSGVILCHENEKGIYGDIAERCLEIHRALPELRAIFDPANYIQCGQGTREAWAMLSPYVEYMHIKDALSDGSVVPAGAGEGELAYLLGEYKGEMLTVEPHLSVFEGFDRLEAGQKTEMGKYVYPDSKAAFHAAVTAIKDMIKEDVA